MEPLLALVDEAIDHWRDSDPLLAELATAHPPPPWPDANEDPFVSLSRAIIHQQVSMAAGRTIYGRFEAAVGEVTPAAVLATPVDRLRAAGLSGQKTTYLLDLADKVTEGSLDLASLEGLDDDSAVAALTAVKGIGVWSAKMFLLFHLQRPDVCPWEDLGVRLAASHFYGIPKDDTTRWLRDEARPRWSPYNSLAARVLWHARRAEG